MEGDNLQSPTTLEWKMSKWKTSVEYLNHGGETRDIEDKVQRIGDYLNDLNDSGPSSVDSGHEYFTDSRTSEWTSSKITSPNSSVYSKKFLESRKRSNEPLRSYNRGTAVRMLSSYLADLERFNILLDDNFQKRVKENQNFLLELVAANQQESNSLLTLHERRKLSLMLEDYQTALSTVLEDQGHGYDLSVDVFDAEFEAKKDLVKGIPLHLYQAIHSSGGYVKSLTSALELCETQVREFKKLLSVVRVFPRQCKNIVETLEPTAATNFEQCHNIMSAFENSEVDGGGIWSASRRNSVHFCFEALVGLARKFQWVVDLLRKCANENLPKTALELADLPPPPLTSKMWSRFSLAIRDCEWNMDLVEFAFFTLEKLLAGATRIFQDASFKWCEKKCRMVLQIQGKLGRPEKSFLSVSEELQAQDVVDLIEQLRRLAESKESVESEEFADFAVSVNSENSVDSAHSAHSVYSSLSADLADSSESILQQMQKVDASRGRLLLKEAFNRTKMAKFLSEKLSGPIPYTRDLPCTFRVEPSSLKFKEYFDSGGSSMVAEHTWLGENVVVKSVRGLGLTWQKFEEEAASLAVVQHPNVVRLIGCGFIDKSKTGQLVMELMDHNLRTVIESKLEELEPGSSPFTINVAIDIILQIAQAMKNLRDHRVLHRNLRTKNVLVNISQPLIPSGVVNVSSMRRPDVLNVLDDTQEDYVVKIIDFGLAKCLPHSSWVRTNTAGRTRWSAPEVFRVLDTEVTHEYKWPADVYSFAMTCYEILTGNLPFADLPKQSIPAAVMAGKRPEGLDELEFPGLLKELVKKCWATNPEERPTFDEIVRSLWECRVEAIVPVYERHVTTSSLSRLPVVLKDTSFEQAGKPNLIGDKLVIDLTQDFLGVSSTGYVIRTICSSGKEQAQPCALKRIDVVDRNRSDLARLNHPHVVQLIDHWIEEKYLFLVMELMDGDLAKLMARTKTARGSPFSLHVTVDLMLQIAKGMLHLHEMEASHPHLKCENILYRAKIKTERFRVGDVLLKLGGFGCSRPADRDSKSRDVLCFGLTCLEILTGDIESSDIISGAHIVPDRADGARSRIPESTPAILRDCIVSCLDTQSTFSEIVTMLQQAQSHTVQTCIDEILYSVESIQTKIVPIKTHDGLDEIFAVHQLHPQLGDVSTSICATLVFFHGFHKVPEEWRRTWMTRDNKVVWPQKWLPEDLGGEKIRVLSVSFDGNSNISNKYKPYELGKNLVQKLVLSPTWKLGELEEAIFLVGHSFGGVLIKSLITEGRYFSQNSIGQQEALKCEKFLKSLAKCVFYSVPHAPMGVEFENYMSECRKIVALQRSSFLHSLQGDTRFIADMNQLSADFESVIPEMKFLTFLEGKAMSMKRLLVTEKSCEGLSSSWEMHKIHQDNHFEVSRPDSRNHTGYKILLGHLQQHINSVKGPSDHDGDSRNIEDELQKRAQGLTDLNASGPGLERASSNQEVLETGRSRGPLHSYHRGTAVRMLTDYLTDLRTLNLSLSETLQKRVEENQAFLIELREANYRDPNSPLTWQERIKLSEMLKDYQSALAAALEDQDDDEEETLGVDDMEFTVEKDVADGVPLYLYEAEFSGGEHVEFLTSALDLCKTHVREFKQLLLVVSVFPGQCKNLVETLEPTAENIFERCDKVLNALSRLEAEGNGVSSSSRRNSVHFCFESLIGLARRFQLVDHLLRKCACASENLHKTALELADLPAPPLMFKRWSEFSLAIRNCEWSMDIVEFAFCTLEKHLAGATLIFQDLSFKWCEEKCRMVLQIQGKPGVQDSRLEKSVLDPNKELETKDLKELTQELQHLGESANGTKWKSRRILSRAAYNRAYVSNFLSKKLSGPIPHARYLPWTFRINTSNLKFKEYLDSGGAGMVGKYTWFGENVAVKNVRSQGLTRNKFEEEAAILAAVQHPNVVRIIGCSFMDKNKTGQLVMELMDHDLRTVIEARVQELGPESSPFSLIVAIDIILQIAQAMKHLKDHKVLHRDLKAKNVLLNIIKPLNSGGESNTSLMQRANVSSVLPYTQENYVAKLADFGLAKCRPHSSWVRTRMAGTTGWRAPEVFHVLDPDVTQEYKWPADVYSFAMTCYEILTGNLPFANVSNQSIHEHVMAGKRPEGLDELDIPDLLKELVRNCWASDPEERPTFDDIVKSLWECRVKAIVPVFERHINVSRSPSSLSLKP